MNVDIHTYIRTYIHSIHYIYTYMSCTYSVHNHNNNSSKYINLIGYQTVLIRFCQMTARLLLRVLVDARTCTYMYCIWSKVQCPIASCHKIHVELSLCVASLYVHDKDCMYMYVHVCKKVSVLLYAAIMIYLLSNSRYMYLVPTYAC